MAAPMVVIEQTFAMQFIQGLPDADLRPGDAFATFAVVGLDEALLRFQGTAARIELVEGWERSIFVGVVETKHQAIATRFCTGKSNTSADGFR